MFKTTTAIVASLSLLAPTLTLAQEAATDQPAEQAQPDQAPVQKHKKRNTQPAAEAAPAAEAPAEPAPKRARKENSPKSEAEPQAAEAAPAAEPETKAPVTRRRAAEPAPEAAPARAPKAAHEAPAEAPAATEAAAPTGKPKNAEAKAEAAREQAAEAEKTPTARPAEVQTHAPVTKPVDAEEKGAKAQENAAEAQRTPTAKPETPKAVTAEDKPTPRTEAPAATAEPDRGAVTTTRAAPKAEASPSEDDLRKALEAESGKSATPENKPKTAAGAAEKPATAETAPVVAEPEGGAVTTTKAAPKAETPTESDLRKALEEKSGKAPTETSPKTAAGAAENSAEKAAAEAAQSEGGAVTTTEAAPKVDKADSQKVAVEEAAPESKAPETAAAAAAAKAVAPSENDALKVLQDRVDGKAKEAAAQGENVTDFAVTDQNARRSDEDFATSVAKSVDEKKKDDHKGRDLARLALAGMAGFAVGEMLSNNRQVALNTGDRVVVTNPDGSQQLIKDDDALLFQPGSNVQTERFNDGSTITTVLRQDGSRVVTIRDANLNILRRSVVYPDGSSHMLIDDTTDVKPVQVSTLPAPARPIDYSAQMSQQELRDALMREAATDRRFTLGQIRDIAQVRALVAPLDIQSITFDTGSAAITPDQAQQLSSLGEVIADSVKQNPRELYLIEGYTDAVGSDASNLALSDRRAESVALALTEYFHVPPENMVVQGYGEQFLKVQSPDAERANRRVAVRRITDLIEQR